MVTGNWPVQYRQVPWSDTKVYFWVGLLVTLLVFTDNIIMKEARVAKRSTLQTPDLEVWSSSFVRRVFSLDNKLYSTLSLFTRCINGYRQHTAGGWPCDGLASHPRGSSNILLGMLHTKETRISSGCLGLWFVCTFTLYLIIKGDFWNERGQKPKANTINWCYNN